MLTVGFEPTPFRTRTLIWRLRPTRPYQLVVQNLLIILEILSNSETKSYMKVPTFQGFQVVTFPLKMTERSFTVITAFKRTLSLSNPHTAACLKSSAFAENSKRWNRFLSIDLRRNLNNHMLEVEGVYVAVMKSYGKKRESPRSSKRLRKDGFLRVRTHCFLL